MQSIAEAHGGASLVALSPRAWARACCRRPPRRCSSACRRISGRRRMISGRTFTPLPPARRRDLSLIRAIVGIVVGVGSVGGTEGVAAADGAGDRQEGRRGDARGLSGGGWPDLEHAILDTCTAGSTAPGTRRMT